MESMDAEQTVDEGKELRSFKNAYDCLPGLLS